MMYSSLARSVCNPRSTVAKAPSAQVMIVTMMMTITLMVYVDTTYAFIPLTSHNPRPQHHQLLGRTTTTLPLSFFTAPQTRTGSGIMEDLTFTTPDVTGIEEQACIDAAKQMKRLAVPVSTTISPSGSVGISYIPFLASPNTRKKRDTPPVILIHGFDSSGLEYRRLGPQLSQRGIDAYAVDILGWGFTQLDDVSTFAASAKVEALKSFVQTLLGPQTPFCVAGASLGGAAAIELAAALSSQPQNNDKKNTNNSNDDSSSPPPTCVGLVLIDAQGFVDGVGPMALMPKPVAKLGVSVLRSVPLRNAANKMSYYNVDQFANDEAQVIGRLHCLRDGWSDAMVSFMQSGGFSPSSKISKINSPALVLWGRQDGILEGKEFANKFVEELPNARLQWIEECGHVPHLEKPEETADAISSFVTSTDVSATSRTYQRTRTDGTGTTATNEEGGVVPSPYVIGGGFLGALLMEEVIKFFF